jgi:hypothetical protein
MPERCAAAASWGEPSVDCDLSGIDPARLADLHEEIDTVLCADADWSKVKKLTCRVELLKPDI